MKSEQDMEEEGTFLKGALGALQNLASDIEKQRLEAHVLETKLIGLRAEAYKIADEIVKYYGLEGEQPSSKEWTKEEMEEIRREEAELDAQIEADNEEMERVNE